MSWNPVATLAIIVPVTEVRLSRMPHIELPRALEDYFAFAETEPTRNGRRFSITLPYLDGDRLDRLQWWYHVNPAQELMYEGGGLAHFRLLAIARFCRHIERWLDITSQRFHGNEPIPRLGLRQDAKSTGSDEAPSATPSTPATELDLIEIDRVVNA